MGKLRTLNDITRGEKKSHVSRIRKAVKGLGCTVGAEAGHPAWSFQREHFVFAEGGVRIVLTSFLAGTPCVPVTVPWGMSQPDIHRLLGVTWRLAVARA